MDKTYPAVFSAGSTIKPPITTPGAFHPWNFSMVLNHTFTSFTWLW